MNLIYYSWEYENVRIFFEDNNKSSLLCFGLLDFLKEKQEAMSFTKRIIIN